jgi:hypothetical protein
MMQILWTHRFVVFDGEMRENAFYVPRDRLLK